MEELKINWSYLFFSLLILCSSFLVSRMQMLLPDDQGFLQLRNWLQVRRQQEIRLRLLQVNFPEKIWRERRSLISELISLNFRIQKTMFFSFSHIHNVQLK